MEKPDDPMFLKLRGKTIFYPLQKFFFPGTREILPMVMRIVPSFTGPGYFHQPPEGLSHFGGISWQRGKKYDVPEPRERLMRKM
jgi:hypothetical protein